MQENLLPLKRNGRSTDSQELTSSYARKYALNGLFLIDDTKDADTMDNSKNVKTEGKNYKYWYHYKGNEKMHKSWGAKR